MWCVVQKLEFSLMFAKWVSSVPKQAPNVAELQVVSVNEWKTWIINYLNLIKDNFECQKHLLYPRHPKAPWVRMQIHNRRLLHSVAASLLDGAQSPSGMLAGLSHSIYSMWPRPWQTETKAPRHSFNIRWSKSKFGNIRHVVQLDTKPRVSSYSSFVCRALIKHDEMSF